MADLKKQFSEVKAHIDAGEYAAARNYLKRIKHPTAREWEKKLDKLDPPGARKAAAIRAGNGANMVRSVVADQLFGIKYFGNGDPDRMVSGRHEGDTCPHCQSVNTVRIDTISTEPAIWVCQCGSCGETFEVVA